LESITEKEIHQLWQNAKKSRHHGDADKSFQNDLPYFQSTRPRCLKKIIKDITFLIFYKRINRILALYHGNCKGDLKGFEEKWRIMQSFGALYNKFLKAAFHDVFYTA